jgi:septum formation protein
VLTAVAVQLEQRFEMAVSESLVTFAPLDEKRIAAYVQSGEPFDKAGAYGIQGRAGAFVERLEGSYSGVMGLPLYETGQLAATIRGNGAVSDAGQRLRTQMNTDKHRYEGLVMEAIS